MERADLDQWKSREVARLLSLVETERRYWQEMVSTLPIALAVLNSQRYILSANRAFRTIFGVRSEELRTRTIEDVFPEASGLSGQIANVIAEGTLLKPQFLTVAHGDHNLRFTVLPHRDWDEDTSIHALLVIEDLTSMVPNEFVLVPRDHPALPPIPPPEVVVPAAAVVAPEAEPEVQKVVATPAVSSMPVGAPAGVWTLQRSTRTFTYVSESTMRMVNAPEDAALWPWLDRIAEPDRETIAAHYEQILEEALPGSIHSCEFRMASVPGRWFRETVAVEAEMLQGVLTDINERRTLEDHLIQSQRIDALATIAGRIAHDLNNPLMIVSGYGEEMLESFAPTDARRADLQQMLDAAERIGELATSLQIFSRKPPGLDGAGAINLREALEQSVEKMRNAAGASLTLDFHPPTNGLKAFADARGLQSLIFELIASTAESATVHVGIRARLAAVQDLAFHRAASLGPGPRALILIENLGHVGAQQRKSPLFESPLPGKDPRNDSGNILARGFRAVESWGGSIWISPDQRTIRLLLRAEKPRPVVATVIDAAPRPVVVVVVDEPVAAVVEPPPPALAPAKRILVVDDEIGIRSLMRKILLREGYDVFEAGDAKEAMQIVRQQDVDLLLTDVVMPEVNGRQLAEQVLALRPQVRVLYVSGFTDETAVESGNYPPGSMLLQKPFTLGSLLKKVKEVLGEQP